MTGEPGMKLPACVGKYAMEEFLGGGMAHVYRARDTIIGRQVAVKILTPAGSQNAGTKARFLAEARAAGNLSHDNILTVYDYGEDEQHGPFMVMEYLQGEDLGKAIRDGHTGDLGGKLNIALQIARALEYVHTQKMVHRDIKPANIHIGVGGVVKLMDFGIAKMDDLALTRTGTIVGTPYYMAPEQVSGQELTGQVDVYAFGLLLFELITGARAISSGSVEQIFYRILNEPLDLGPTRQAGVPEALSNLVARCAAKDASARPSGFAPVCAEIERIAGGLDAASTLILPARGMAKARAGAAVVGIMLILGATLWIKSIPPHPRSGAPSKQAPPEIVLPKAGPAGKESPTAHKSPQTTPPGFAQVANDIRQHYGSVSTIDREGDLTFSNTPSDATDAWAQSETWKPASTGTNGSLCRQFVRLGDRQPGGAVIEMRGVVLYRRGSGRWQFLDIKVKPVANQ